MIWFITGLLCYLYLIVAMKNEYKQVINHFSDEEPLVTVATPLVMVVLGPINIAVAIAMKLHNDGDEVAKED